MIANINFTHLRTNTLAIDSHPTIVILSLIIKNSYQHKSSYDGTPQLHSSSDNSSCENSCNTQVFSRNHLMIANINFTHLRTNTLAIDSHPTIVILSLIIKNSYQHKSSYDGTPQLHSSSDNSSCENSCNTQVFPRNHLTIANINFTHLRINTLAIDSHQNIIISPLIINKLVSQQIILRWHTSTSLIIGQLVLRKLL